MAHASRPSAVGRGTLAFLYGLCEVEELPGSYLVEVFGALNMSASGARSYLARAVADGRLVSHRRGRQTAYALNGTFLRRYRTIEHRFISQPDWEGRFHIVIYDIPETRRSERDALRAAAFADGWASRASCRTVAIYLWTVGKNDGCGGEGSDAGKIHNRNRRCADEATTQGRDNAFNSRLEHNRDEVVSDFTCGSSGGQ